MNVYMINSGYDGCCYPRIYLPCVHNGFRTDKPDRAADRISVRDVRENLQWADIVVFHRAEEQEYHDLAKLLKADGKKIVMDNDDTFKLEDFHPLAQFTPEGKFQDNLARRENNINEFIKNCDLVTTTTETLAREYRELNNNVIILPNYVDPFDWDEPLRNTDNKVRIGIVGSAAIEYDYLHVKDVLQQLSDREDVELVMFGLGDRKHRKDNPVVTKVFHDEYAFWDTLKIDHYPWVKNYLYPQTLNEMKLDLMIIPRKDNYFNRCKSNIKFLEASMLEIPVIAQSFDNSPYEEITPDMGVLIKDNNKWLEEINRLVADKKLRQAMGKKAKKYVLANYNIENNYYKWADAYKNLCEQ